MRYQLLLAVLSLGPVALALVPHQSPVNTVEGTSDQPLDVTDLNTDDASPHPSSPISDVEQWNFHEGPRENTTCNLIFDTVHSLLQHWPNTRYRNGHNIVPGVVPTGTLLYHGTGTDKIPTEPDWTATDPEHSIIFSRGMRGMDGGWHLTLATTRPLKVLYFDGSSAAKVPEGTMDIQDVMAWGEPQQNRFRDERKRIVDLCRWGKEFGIDGFVRMEMDFEVMLCDFTAGVKVVSFLNVVAPWRGKVSVLPHIPPPYSDALVRQFEVMHAGSWHNRYPGDSRIMLDLTGLISLYDTELAPSLIPVRADLERWDHRVLGISSEDISQVMRRLTEVVSRPSPMGSGIDWKTLINVIVDRYADRLELMQHLLNYTSSDSQELLQRAKLAQAQLRVMLTPYLLHSTVVPNANTSGVHRSQWTYPIFRQCATTHTSELTTHMHLMTSSEHLLLKAVEETTIEICRVTTNMWVTGVMSGLDSLFEVEPHEEPDVVQLFDGWRDDTQKLMSWLDWSVWIKCRPTCSPEEMCYLPTWPVNAPPPIDHGPPRKSPIEDPAMCPAIAPPESLAIANMMFPIFAPPTEEWMKPQPKCIRRIQPYGF